MKFIIWSTFAWGILLIVLGIQSTAEWLKDDSSFFDAGGPIRIINGSVMIMLSMGLYRIDEAIYRIRKGGKSIDLHTLFHLSNHGKKNDKHSD